MECSRENFELTKAVGVVYFNIQPIVFQSIVWQPKPAIVDFDAAVGLNIVPSIANGDPSRLLAM